MRSLRHLPPAIGDLVELKCLELSGCESLSVLPDTIGGLQKLKTLELKSCVQCQRKVGLDEPRFKFCARCREVHYCSKKCQREHWEVGNHARQCKLLRRMRRRACDVCGAVVGRAHPPFPVCGACGKRRYCGEACQIADWEAGHAKKCGAAIRNEIFDALTDDEV